ncbi:DUF4397 domain-containing protein [Chitinimonas sp. BJYL2]|uniref:DUF4397 domain-containing protein n=1 Tax=Chitinimonas sp. BJYL2 TaxID=2976696 RepID=UPI0022B424A2|nr:DUF4397 domain-containing protein [Chitinimonas sp. BJYL2]
MHRLTHYWRALACVLGIAGLLAGCNVESLKGDDDDSIHPQLRFVNLLPDQASVQVELEDAIHLASLVFESPSSYADKDWQGSYDVEVKTSSGALLNSFTISPTQKLHHTTYLFGSTNSMGGATLVDEAVSVNSGKFIARTLLAATNLPAYDLYITSDSTLLSDVSPTAYAASVGQASSWSDELAAGRYRVRLTQTGSKVALFDSSVEFAANANYTLVLYSLGSAQLPTVMLMQPGEGGGVVLRNSAARLRLVQGNPDVVSMRVDIGGSSAYRTLPFGVVTAYAQRTAGDLALNIADENGIAASKAVSVQLAGGKDYSVFLIGDSSDSRARVYDDLNLAVTSTKVAGRFINASLDQANVDAVMNYQPLVSSLANAAMSASIDLDAIAYPVSFNAATGGSLASTTTDTLTASAAYTFGLLGRAGNYRIVSYLRH